MSKSTSYNKYNNGLPNRRIFLVIILIICCLCRQSIYHASIVYRIGQERLTDTLMDANFERFILRHPDVYDRYFNNIDKIIHVSLKVTADALSFKGELTTKTHPLSTLNLGEANSEGYAAFFKTVCTYLIRRYHFSDTYICRQYIAERTKNGENLQDAIHTLSGSSPFNKYRDVLAIINVRTGERKFVDPVIYDQFNIVGINVSNEEKASLNVKESLDVLRAKSQLFARPQR